MWLDCHVRMYEAFHGVASITVPDNLRSAIASPDRYEAEIKPRLPRNSPSTTAPALSRRACENRVISRTLHIASCVNDRAGINFGRIVLPRPPRPLTSTAPLSGS